jgi:ABC-type phosphate/phosphonate transport system permease subunit
MLEPIRAIRVIGSLVLFIGAIFLLVWKIAAFAVSTGMSRYANFTGKLAKKFFSQDQSLVALLQTAETLIPWLLLAGILVSCIGILIIAFPKQAMQILCAMHILRRGR